MTTSAAGATPAIQMQGIDKYFGAIRANTNASIEVMPGEIHALVGENGAGKSTLMRILGGLMQPDAGTIRIAGRDVTGWNTASAIDAGIGVVHQHFMLVPTLTVAENVVLGREPTRRGLIDYRKAHEDVATLSRETGLKIDPDRLVSDLSVGEAQRVEILKTLYRGSKILVLDEPTAVLSPPEVKELWAVLRKLRDNGDTIVLITHRLDEVIEISDTITVMRAGTTVTRFRTADTTPARIAHEMVGREVRLSTDRRGGQAAASSAPSTPVLEVSNITVLGAGKKREVEDVSFTIMAGEILGIAGVEGNGQTELIEALAGLRPLDSGTIRINGNAVTGGNARDRRQAGLSHIPEDRLRRGLILEYSVADNLVLGEHGAYSRNRLMDTARVSSNADERIAEYDIRPAQQDLSARSLSGGNQQKIVLAREMGRDFSVLLASQPTRGVDVGAIEFIHERLLQARAAGKAILLVSAELKEVLALADRVAVMYRGKIATLLPIADATEDVLGEYMIGTRRDSAA